MMEIIENLRKDTNRVIKKAARADRTGTPFVVMVMLTPKPRSPHAHNFGLSVTCI